MKKMTKMLCALLCGVLLCGAVAVATPKENNAASAAPVRKQIVLEPEKPRTASLKIGEQIKLSVGSANIGKKSENQAAGSGESADKDTSWGVLDDSDAVTVEKESGVVTAEKTGTATVGKILGDGRKVSCTITVSGFAVKQMTIEGTQEMRVGETQKLQLSITPTEARDTAKITWKSDDSDVLSVDSDGKVTAHQAGSATIRATTGNVVAKLTISVVSDLESLTIQPNSTKMFVGDNIAVQVTPTPAGTNIDAAQWESENPAVAYYKDGRIYGVGVGTTRITVSVGMSRRPVLSRFRRAMDSRTTNRMIITTITIIIPTAIPITIPNRLNSRQSPAANRAIPVREVRPKIRLPVLEASLLTCRTRAVPTCICRVAR